MIGNVPRRAPSPASKAAVALAVVSGLAVFCWRRKVAGKPVLPALLSAVSAAMTALGLTTEWKESLLRDSDAETENVNAAPMPLDVPKTEAPKQGKE